MLLGIGLKNSSSILTNIMNYILLEASPLWTHFKRYNCLLVSWVKEADTSTHFHRCHPEEHWLNKKKERKCLFILLMKFKINVLIYTEKHTWLFSESKKKYIEQSIAFKNQPVVCYFSKSINKFYFETPKTNRNCTSKQRPRWISQKNRHSVIISWNKKKYTHRIDQPQ